MTTWGLSYVISCRISREGRRASATVGRDFFGDSAEVKAGS